MSTPMPFRALALGIVRWGNSFHWPSVKSKTTFLELSRRPLEVKKKQYLFSTDNIWKQLDSLFGKFCCPLPSILLYFFLASYFKPHHTDLTILSFSFKPCQNQRWWLHGGNFKLSTTRKATKKTIAYKTLGVSYLASLHTLFTQN